MAERGSKTLKVALKCKRGEPDNLYKVIGAAWGKRPYGSTKVRAKRCGRKPYDSEGSKTLKTLKHREPRQRRTK